MSLTPVDGSSSSLDAAYELARRLSEAGVRRMSGDIFTHFLFFFKSICCVVCSVCVCVFVCVGHPLKNWMGFTLLVKVLTILVFFLIYLFNWSLSCPHISIHFSIMAVEDPCSSTVVPFLFLE